MTAMFRNGYAPRGRRTLRPQVEGVEARLLMSVTPVGPEFRANTYTAGDQQTATLFANGLPDSTAPMVATGASGSVVTWTSNGQDGSSWGVYAQRYDAGGLPQGGEFHVNTTTAGEQRHPTVAMAGDGRFVVAWSSLGQDGSGFGVYLQRYDATGLAQGGETRVNSTTIGHQVYPALAMAGDGSFAVTWTSAGQDGSGNGVYLQRYDTTGLAQGGETRINSTTAGDQQNSTIAMAADGRSVVIWWSGDGLGWGIFAQRFDASGRPSGREVRVNSYASSNQAFSAVAMAPDGRYVVAWSSYGQDGSGNSVYARRYDLTGQFLGNEFRVNTTTASEQTYPSVGMDSNGRFTVVWSSLGQDGSGWGVYLRPYHASGDSDGLEVRANSYVANHQVLPSIAMGPDPDMVVVWTSLGQDGSGNGVYGQRFRSDDAPPPLTASLIVDDTSVAEGNSGTTDAAFTVHLVTPATQTVTVDYATASDIARDGNDFLGVRGTLTFAPGETSKTVNVAVLGDTVAESDETFYLGLANSTNAQILRGQAVGTIRNEDETLPSLSIDDVAVAEGNSGTTDAVFTVHLSTVSTHLVTVQYLTAFGTATAPSDFDGTSSTLMFDPGETTATIVVPVHGDKEVEPDETFYVELLSPVYATIADGQAVGTIRNDDQAPLGGSHAAGEAAFSPATGLDIYPNTTSDVVVADFNHDGRPDIAATATLDRSIVVLLNRGDGTFLPPVRSPVNGRPMALVVGDLNHDGMRDLATVNEIDNTVSVLYGNGRGGFPSSRSFAAGRNPSSLAVIDYDGDGWADLAVTNDAVTSYSGGVTVFRNVGGLGFQAAINIATGYAPRFVSAPDFNGDGHPDLLVVNSSSNTASVLINQRAGSFRLAGNYPTGSGPVAAAAVDLDGDGRIDLAVASRYDNLVLVRRGLGDGQFESPVRILPVGSQPSRLVAGDFDGDGRVDLATTNYGSNDVTALRNLGGGTFAAPESYPVGLQPQSLAAGDLNGDGRADLAVANGYSYSISLLFARPRTVALSRAHRPTSRPARAGSNGRSRGVRGQARPVRTYVVQTQQSRHQPQSSDLPFTE